MKLAGCNLNGYTELFHVRAALSIGKPGIAQRVLVYCLKRMSAADIAKGMRELESPLCSVASVN